MKIFYSQGALFASFIRQIETLQTIFLSADIFFMPLKLIGSVENVNADCK